MVEASPALSANMDPTPAIMKAMAKKRKKYAPLVHLGHVMHLKRRCSKRLPVFVAGAVSHSGKMAAEFFTLAEWLTGHRRRAANVSGSLYDTVPQRGWRRNSAPVSRQGFKRLWQGRRGGLWHALGSRGPPPDNVARDAARWDLNCFASCLFVCF